MPLGFQLMGAVPVRKFDVETIQVFENLIRDIFSWRLWPSETSGLFIVLHFNYNFEEDYVYKPGILLKLLNTMLFCREFAIVRLINGYFNLPREN